MYTIEQSSKFKKDLKRYAHDKEKLIALMELITGYPEKDDAFIGWFMVDAAMQGQGIGSRIFADVRAAMKGQGYDYLSLGCVRENREAIAFWESQGFHPTGETADRDGYQVDLFGRSI